jgi:hypothetical protein
MKMFNYKIYVTSDSIVLADLIEGCTEHNESFLALVKQYGKVESCDTTAITATRTIRRITKITLTLTENEYTHSLLLMTLPPNNTTWWFSPKNKLIATY